MKTGLEKHRIDTAAVYEIRWQGSGVLDAGDFILMCSGNESNSFGTGFLINMRYKQEIMNFEAADERICSLRMRGKFNNFTVLSVRAPTGENDELFSDSLYDKLKSDTSKNSITKYNIYSGRF